MKGLNFNPIVDEFYLDQIRFYVEQRLSKSSLRICNVPEIHFLDCIDSLMFRLELDLRAEKLGDFEKNIVFTHPNSWWQCFKQQYFPKWLLKKFPVKNKRIVKKVAVTINAVYPQAPALGSSYKNFIIHSKIEEKYSDIEIEVKDEI